ncbi:MAG: metal ABC transporter permease [Phycisphaerales bacterium]
MTALDALRDIDFLVPLLAGMALTAACSLISVLVTLKRLAFIGQGISHAGFGGVGLASFLALTGFSRELIIFAFCVLTGLLIGALTRTRKIMIDTAIGVMLVATMAIGFLLDQMRINLRGVEWYQTLVNDRNLGLTPTSWENVLFGSILWVRSEDLWIALAVSVVVIGILAFFFREIVFYAFDETVSRVFGVRVSILHYLVLGLLAALIVMTMKLVGLILVNALLVVPGATANLLSRRLGVVLLLSVVIGEIGMVGGYLLAFQVLGGEVGPGPWVVLLLGLQFALALGWSRVRQPSENAPISAAATDRRNGPPQA